MSKTEFYRNEMEDLDPNYDESNAELDRYEREADYYAAECAEGVMIDNLEDETDPARFLNVSWNDCYEIRKRYGNM